MAPVCDPWGVLENGSEVPDQRLRVIEVAGVEREDGLKAQSDHHSQSRCRARGRWATTVPGGRPMATN